MYWNDGRRGERPGWHWWGRGGISPIPAASPSPFQAMFWKTFSLAGLQSPWEQTGHPVPPSSRADSGRSMCDHKNTAGSDLFWEIHSAEPIQRPGSFLLGPDPGLWSRRWHAEKQHSGTRGMAGQGSRASHDPPIEVRRLSRACQASDFPQLRSGHFSSQAGLQTTNWATVDLRVGQTQRVKLLKRMGCFVL